MVIKTSEQQCRMVDKPRLFFQCFRRSCSLETVKCRSCKFQDFFVATSTWKSEFQSGNGTYSKNGKDSFHFYFKTAVEDCPHVPPPCKTYVLFSTIVFKLIYVSQLRTSTKKIYISDTAQRQESTWLFGFLHVLSTFLIILFLKATHEDLINLSMCDIFVTTRH